MNVTVRGIRVLMDFIFNHADADAPLTQIDHDYWYSREPSDPDNSWGPEFNYDKYDENLDTQTRMAVYRRCSQVLDRRISY